MTRHPVADDCGKLAGLEIEPAIFPRRHADSVFVESDLGAVVGRIETAVDARLRENVNRTSELRVDKQT